MNDRHGAGAALYLHRAGAAPRARAGVALRCVRCAAATLHLAAGRTAYRRTQHPTEVPYFPCLQNLTKSKFRIIIK